MIKDKQAIQTGDVQPPITGSPIIIGGGAMVDLASGPIEGAPNPVFCKFDHDVYKSKGISARKKFELPGKQIKSVILKIENDTFDFSKLLNGSNGEIEIECPGFGNNLKLFGNPIGIEFDTENYKQQETDPSLHKSEDSYVSKVKIDFPGLNIRKKLTATDNWSIKVDYPDQKTNTRQ